MKQGSSWWCPVTGQEGDRRILKHRRFHLHIRKHFFTVRVVKNWHRLPSKAGYPS